MASPVAWITSALDSTFWAKACEGSGHKGSPLAATPRPPAGPTHLHGIHAVLLGGGHVEPDLHERDLGVVVLVELQRHLVLARGALGHVAERDLEHRLLPDVEGQQLPCGDVTASSSCAPQIPSPATVSLLSQNPAVLLLASLHSHPPKPPGFLPSGCMPLVGTSHPTASGCRWDSPPNLTVPQFQPFTHRSFSASSRQ